MKHYDIAIVGMGPVGAAAAIFLAQSGLKVVTVERDAEVYALPRAVAMDGEVIRAFQRIGAGQSIADLMEPVAPGYRAGFGNSKREWLFGVELTDFGTNGWAPNSMFDQPEVDGYLRDSAACASNVTTYSGYQLHSFEQNGDAVTINIGAVGKQTEDRIDLSASYLLACDGASSGIRKTLEIPWHDLGYDHDWLVVDVIVNDKHTLKRETLQVCDPARLTTYVCGKGPYRRWEFKLKAGESPADMLQPQRIHELLKPWTPQYSYTLRRQAVYQFHAAVAAQWSSGRVFLLGDAAHQTPPFLGQGMNAGMRDAINIAWKLALVLSATAKPELLQHYQRERAAHAQDLVQWAVDFGHLMEHVAAGEAAQQQGLAAPQTQRSGQSSGYGQGREAPPLREGVLIREQVSNEGSTGYLFSQPRVRDGSGCEFLLDQNLGPGFAIVLRDDTEVALNSHSLAIVERLNIRISSLHNLSVVRGHFDRLFTDANAVIVRPDRYVFGHTTEQLNLDQLLAQLAEKIYLVL